jgi:hypothetical protein
LTGTGAGVLVMYCLSLKIKNLSYIRNNKGR